MSCEVCKWIEEKKDIKIVYEDEKSFVVLSNTPKALGHMIVFPKEHHDSIEDIPRDIVSHLFFVASFAATAVFEGLGSQGTNIIANDGSGSEDDLGHFGIHIVPRKEEDGLGLKWEPNKDEAAKVEDTLSQIKDKACFIGQEGEIEETQKEVIPEESKSEKTKGVLKDEEGAENYLIKQLRRIP